MPIAINMQKMQTADTTISEIAGELTRAMALPPFPGPPNWPDAFGVGLYGFGGKGLFDIHSNPDRSYRVSINTSEGRQFQH